MQKMLLALGLAAHKEDLIKIRSPNMTSHQIDIGDGEGEGGSNVFEPFLTLKERFLTATFFFFLNMEQAFLSSYPLRRLLTTITASCKEMEWE